MSNISSTIDLLEGNIKKFDKQEEYILSHARRTIFHSIRYANIITSEYGISSYLVTFFKDNEICGLIILYNCPIFPFGKKLTDLIFSGSYGGILCNEDILSQDLIVQLKLKFKEPSLIELKLSQESLRHLRNDFNVYVNYKLNLQDNIDDIWLDKVDTKARNLVRKASKSGLEFSLYGIEGFEDFYNVYKKTMKGLGSPALSYNFFKKLTNEFPKEIIITIVTYNKFPISALFNTVTTKKMHNVWAGSLFEFRKYCPNYMNYWELIKWCKSNNINEFDFGRSVVSSTHESFKKQWGAESTKLYYYDLLKKRHSKGIDSKSSAVLLFNKIWRFSPYIITNILNKYFLKRTG